MTNIVMLVRDRYKLTKQALDSLYAHTPQDQFNLTIVDDGSADFRVIKLLESIQPRFKIRLHDSNHVLAQAKNLGVYASEQRFGRGDWLYLSDNDVYFKPGWLAKLTIAAASTELQGFALWGGQVHPYHKAVVPGEVTSIGESVLEYSILDGPSWLMRWRTWVTCGPLQGNAPGACQSEEYPFCEKVLARGGGYVKDDWRDHGFYKLGRIGVIHPHVVLHTGLTQTDGKDAPGRKEREAQMEAGVIYE